MVIEIMMIDARFEWFSISSGQSEDNEITDRWRALAKLVIGAETKYFPNGLPIKPTRQNRRSRPRPCKNVPFCWQWGDGTQFGLSDGWIYPGAHARIASISGSTPSIAITRFML